MSADPFRAFRQLERLMPSISPYRDLRPPFLKRPSTVLCSSCSSGVHQCTRGVTRVTIIYDLRDSSRDRVERAEVPCECYRCKVATQQAD